MRVSIFTFIKSNQNAWWLRLHNKRRRLQMRLIQAFPNHRLRIPHFCLWNGLLIHGWAWSIPIYRLAGFQGWLLFQGICLLYTRAIVYLSMINDLWRGHDALYWNFLFVACTTVGHPIGIKVKALEIGMRTSLILRVIHASLLSAELRLCWQQTTSLLYLRVRWKLQQVHHLWWQLSDYFFLASQHVRFFFGWSGPLRVLGSSKRHFHRAKIALFVMLHVESLATDSGLCF